MYIFNFIYTIFLAHSHPGSYKIISIYFNSPELVQIVLKTFERTAPNLNSKLVSLEEHRSRGVVEAHCKRKVQISGCVTMFQTHIAPEKFQNYLVRKLSLN